MVLESVETSREDVKDGEVATRYKTMMKKNAATLSLSTKAGRWQKSGKRRLYDRESSVQLLILKLYHPNLVYLRELKGSLTRPA